MERHQSITTETTPLLASRKYSVFTPIQKRLIILTAALASSFSPFSANIYYPVLNAIASDLHVTSSQINLTITTYMICQGLAPTFMGSFADQAGRRPAYILCFLIYIMGNIALALQHSYPALLILRAVQSCGSSGTVALASAVAADIITSAERGLYMGFTSLGNILAPSLGPILGGILSEYLGWRAIFWFLAVSAAIFFTPLFLFFPETCRALVGDGSIPPSSWRNRSILAWWRLSQEPASPALSTTVTSQTSSTINHPIPAGQQLQELTRKSPRPNPLSALWLLIHLPTGLILISNGIIFASYYAVTAGIPSQFKRMYNLSDLGIGFSFIPAGIGSLISATFNGVIIDWNYRRLQAQTSTDGKDSLNSGNLIPNNSNSEQLPIERARLQIGIPMAVLSATSVLIYGLTISTNPPLSISLTLLFAVSFCITAAYNVMNVLLVDLHYGTPATVMAANNLVRCFLGAAATAIVHPMIERWGNAITYSAVAIVMGAVCPLLAVVYRRGLAWRVGKKERNMVVT